jgi:hypothetical protein
LSDSISRAAAWRPASTGRDRQWEAPGEAAEPEYHTFIAHEVHFSRQDEPGATAVIWLYAAWYGEEPDAFGVHFTWEWSRADGPDGSRTWSWTDGGQDQAGYLTITAADDRARYLAGLLSQGSYRDIARTVPGLCDALGWDGARPAAEAVPAAA